MNTAPTASIDDPSTSGLQVLPRPHATTLRETIAVSKPVFLELAARAAATLHDPVTGERWALDGHQSDRVYLRLPQPPIVGLPYLETVFDVAFFEDGTVLSVTDASPAVLGLFLHFVASLKMEVLKGREA